MNAGANDTGEQSRTKLSPVPRSLPKPTFPAPPADRLREAARDDSSLEALRELANDPDMIVRAALATNGACSPEIDAMLAADADDRVRALLGIRIARLLPGLGDDAQGLAAEHIRSTLALLARDQAIRVRVAITDEIKTMDIAPRDLVLLLARDHAVEVSAPILRLSPVLTDADLISLLATPTLPSSVEAIANRPRLSAAVADAIVAYADAPTIRTLLANRSACIQEATLDALVGRAPDHAQWHAPLVRRPALSAKAIRALSEFITVDLLHVLASRADLDPAKIDIVRQRLAAKAARVDDSAGMAEAQLLHANKGLTESFLLDTLHAGDKSRGLAFVAAASGITLQALERVIELRSAKALVSVVWGGGFTMRVGTAAQTALAQFGPSHALMPSASGDFPLTEEEMEWQLELVRGTTEARSRAGS